jgi:hypothetical protein
MNANEQRRFALSRQNASLQTIDFVVFLNLREGPLIAVCLQVVQSRVGRKTEPVGSPGCSDLQILVGLRWLAKTAVISGHEHEIARNHIRRLGPPSKMNADRARKLAVEAAREADPAEAPAWSLRIEGFSGPSQPRQPSRNVSPAATAGWR